eukprot:16044-Heterococcus_DN1.PRE.1
MRTRTRIKHAATQRNLAVNLGEEQAPPTLWLCLQRLQPCCEEHQQAAVWTSKTECLLFAAADKAGPVLRRLLQGCYCCCFAQTALSARQCITASNRTPMWTLMPYWDSY